MKKDKSKGKKDAGHQSKSANGCGSCGHPSYSKGEKCLAVGRSCAKCKEEGHFAKMCPSSKKKEAKPPSEKEKKAAQIRILQVSPSQQAPLISAEILDEDRDVILAKVMAVPDSGAEICVAVDQNFWNYLIGT